MKRKSKSYKIVKQVMHPIILLGSGFVSDNGESDMFAVKAYGAGPKNYKRFLKQLRSMLEKLEAGR